MDDPTLAHSEERLGHVAVDMGFMTMFQFDECRKEMVRLKREGGSEVTLGELAIRLGFISRDDLEVLTAEEKRRRRLINGYEIIDLIGSGTIATVYRALQRAMDREVALKILHPRLASDPDFVKAYIAEARAVSRFHHPHIVQGIDVGESNGFYYFAHEYLSGGSLASLLQSEGALTEGKALLYLRQTTSALRHAWEVAVFHGDLNPGNLLLDSQGNIKLANLGVPRVAKPQEKNGGDDKNLAFVRCGPEYAAPEQIERPELVNATTDIYNLGATFYHLSFGTPPFSGASIDDIIEKRRQNPQPSFTLQSQGAFSPKYIKLIHDMLEINPADRPSDPDDLGRRLEKFHVAGSDEWSGLARQVKKPSSVRKGSSSRRSSARRTAAPREQSVSAFSLKKRESTLLAAPSRLWLAVAAVLAILLAGWLILY